MFARAASAVSPPITGSGDEEARAIDRRRVLVAQLETRGLIVAEAEHRGDAVDRVGAQLAQQVVARIRRGDRSRSPVVAGNVAVRVDQTGKDRLALEVDARRRRPAQA